MGKPPAKKKRSKNQKPVKPAPKPVMADQDEDKPILAPPATGEEPELEPAKDTELDASEEGPSQLSALLEGKRPVAPNVEGNEKREREAGGPSSKPEGEGEGIPKKAKREVLNRASVRAIVQEENGLLLVGAESKMRTIVREELRALLGISEPNNTLQAALTKVYQETLRAALQSAQQKTEPYASSVSGSLGPQRADWGDIAKLSAIGSTLDDVERLVKTKADSDAVRELRTIALDGKAVLDSLRFNETSRDKKLDSLRNLIASSAGFSPASLMQNAFGNPWGSHFAPPSGSIGGPGGPHIQSLAALAQAPNPSPSFAAVAAPAPDQRAAQPVVNLAQFVPSGPAQAPDARAAAAARRTANDHLAVAIRAKWEDGRFLNAEGLSKTPEGIKALLRDDLDFPAAAIDAAGKFIIIKPRVGTGETIHTCKVSFSKDSHRVGFLAVAANEHVAGKLAQKNITIEEWQPKEDTLIEHITRFSRDTAAEAKKKLDESLSALFQNSAAASAIQGLHATSRAFGGALRTPLGPCSSRKSTNA